MTTLPPFLTVIIVVIKHLSALPGLRLTGRHPALLGIYVSLLFTIANPARTALFCADHARRWNNWIFVSRADKERRHFHGAATDGRT
ncbi:hypothetical protein AGR1A_Cc60346 [Agrobacterium fabacearum CFBP 5771]|nr:hypothetical protein AGR1B_Cc140010 [Agrobacterium fabacearum S56]CVI19592.1 hypothetical protein AGR1A_Cc60346 [Agrobacterium fabacearum CFBP 5771]